MDKTYTQEHNWVLADYQRTPGRGRVECHRWRWVSVDTGEVLETTTDRTMRNWHQKGWSALAEDPNPWGIYSNIQPAGRETARGIRVATADQRPCKEHRLTEPERDYILNEIRKPSTAFDDIFVQK